MIDKDKQNEIIGGCIVTGFIMITVIAIVAGCLGGCYICESTKRKYLAHGYVEQWNHVRQRTEWVKAEDAGHEQAK